ncbi:MAG: sugar transferase [Deltaproteobacteria bacterium]|nr:sugar transferase [Deltaproteobacteria bacterium]
MTEPPRTAVVLAGGLPFAEASLDGVRPKILLPVANRPLISYLGSVLAAAGVNHLIICLNTTTAEAWSSLEQSLGGLCLQLECVVHKIPRGTGGSLKQVENRLDGNPFWVVSGDLFLETDLRPMVAAHQESGLTATVGVLRVEETPWEMERVEVNAERRVRAIHRMHPAQNKRSMLRPAGLYLFEASVLELIPQRGHFDLKEQLFPLLAEKELHAGVWEIPGYCRTISSVADYFTANRDVLLRNVVFPYLESCTIEAAARAPSRDPSQEVSEQIGLSGRPLDASVNTRVSLGATLLSPVLLGTDCDIGDAAIIIGPTAIGGRCVIEDNAVVDECVLLPGASIGRNARLDRCVIGDGAIVEPGASLREMIIFGRPVKAAALGGLPGRQLPLNSSGLLQLSEWRIPAPKLFLKRVFDTLVAGVGLIISAPLMALIGLAIKLDSPGKVVFRQPRCGLGGREFVLYKFRSMVAESENLKRELLSLNQVDGPMFKIIDDPRNTRVGRFLRATNLDELPQLWNVLLGDMSLVGPRPLSMDEMRYNPYWRDVRLSVRPGLTGLWQVKAHSKTSFADWIRYDLYYANNLSPWLDLKILAKTFLNSFLPKRSAEVVARRTPIQEKSA